MTESVFDRARDQWSIADVVGTSIKLTRQGKQVRGECPLCGAGKKSGSTPFSADPVKKLWKCWACQEQGDVITLYAMIHGYERLDAAKRMAGDMSTPAPVRRPEPVKVHMPEGPSFSEVMAWEVWREAMPAKNTPAQRYLLGRGICGQPLLNAVSILRFHPHVYHSGPWNRPLHFPAVVAQVVAPDDDGRPIPTGGITCIYLRPGGQGKARVPHGEKAKKMWGPQTMDGRPGGVWLAPWDGEGAVVTGEGIETALSLAVLHAGPCRPLATLSLDRLQGGWRADKFGCRDPRVPQIDTGRPALTWPEPPGAPFGRVLIGVDHDMGPVKVKVPGAVRNTAADHVLSASDRAQICASLASQWWRRAAPAASIEPLIAPLGQDWNDYLQESLT